MFTRVVHSLLGEAARKEKHILYHERVWIDGHWLNQEYPELEVMTVTQKTN